MKLKLSELRRIIKKSLNEMKPSLKSPMKVHTLFYVERPDSRGQEREIEVQVVGTYHPYRPATLIDPEEGNTIDDIRVYLQEDTEQEFELTPEELQRATQQLWDEVINETDRLFSIDYREFH
jgi:hypothetical protein